MSSPELSVTFLDVGQGDATIVLPPEGDAIVFDFGRDGWEVAQQLKTWGVKRLEAVIASHLDLDHVGGMLTVLEAYGERINAVYCSADRNLTDGRDGATNAKRLTDAVHNGDGAKWEMRAVERDTRGIARGDRWSVEIIAPRGSTRDKPHRTGRFEEPNRYSAVLRIKVGDNTLLVGADAPLCTWAELGEETRCEVFRVPHHGGALEDGGVPDGWSAERLYQHRPKVAVLSVGTNNRHDHPTVKPWIEPLRVNRCRLLCTQVTGRCHEPFLRDAASQEQSIRAARTAQLDEKVHGDLNHFSEPPWRHYQQRGKLRQDRLEVPCAGTITVRMTAEELRVDPAPGHPSLSTRIDRWRSPLCRQTPPGS